MISDFQTFIDYRDKDITINDKLLGISVCGHDFLTPEIHRVSIERNNIGNVFKKLGLIMHSVKVSFNLTTISRKNLF